MIVNRKPLTFAERLYLPAIIGGFKVTIRHALRSLFGGKTVTMEYPEQKWAVPLVIAGLGTARLLEDMVTGSVMYGQVFQLLRQLGHEHHHAQAVRAVPAGASQG